MPARNSKVKGFFFSLSLFKCCMHMEPSYPQQFTQYAFQSLKYRSCCKKKALHPNVLYKKIFTHQFNSLVVFKFLITEFGFLEVSTNEILKPEQSGFVLPVTTRSNKQRQGLNSYGHFIQMAGDLRRWWLTYPKRPSYISSQPFFISRKKCRKGVWNSEKPLSR